MDYSTVYINPPDHVAVGIWGTDLYGSYYTYNDKTYYYCETTGEGFEIGESPAAYRNQEAYIYDIRDYEQYDPTTGIIPSDDQTTGTILHNVNYASLGLIISVLVFGFIAFRVISAQKENDQLLDHEIELDRTEPIS